MITPSSLHNLIPQKPKWIHLPTKAIRLPECFLPQIHAYAVKLDQAVTRPSLPLPSTFLGIKPSIAHLGWSILAGSPDTPKLVDYGLIETDAQTPFPQRLAEIETDLRELLDEFAPTQVFVAQPFMNPEYPLAMNKTYQVLGVINLVVYRFGGVFPQFIAPASWKSLLDSPTASREDLAFALSQLFDLPSLPLNPSVEAIALAYFGLCSG